MIDCVISPVDQTLPVAADEVRTTEPPAQKVVVELAVIVGVAGTGLTVTEVEAETPEAQPEAMTSTEKLPEVVTVIDCVVSPVGQMLSVADEEVSTTDPPSQKVVGPLVVIVGTTGTGLTVTVVGAELADVHPFAVDETL